MASACDWVILKYECSFLEDNFFGEITDRPSSFPIQFLPFQQLLRHDMRPVLIFGTPIDFS